MTDLQLVQIVDAALADAARIAGAHLACYAGCAVCCFGPFPITALDAHRIRQGLSHAEPGIAAAIQDRAQAARAEMAAAYPGNATTGALPPDLDEARFAGRFANLACPVLDPDSGACLMYDARPIACRLYGLPSRVDGDDLPPCPLCFRRAVAADVEAARAVIDLRDKARELQELPRTVIAYALTQPEPPPSS